jgi:putative inorganic carbon (hco3(-)) transporter
MRRDSEAAIFWLTATSAAAALVSIAAMEVLLTAAVLLWIIKRPTPVKWPSYFFPLAAFMVTTLLSLAMSPEPGVGFHAIQKFVLFSMGLLAAAYVTTESRAENALKLLLSAASVSAVVAITQFVLKEMTYLRTGNLASDPTLLDRITGTLGHVMTFSGVELLVWCAALPAISFLSRKWIAAFSVVSIAIVLSNTRGVWLGALAGFAFLALALPRKIVIAVLILIVTATIAASPFIYRRLSMSLDPTLATNYSRVRYLAAGAKMIKAHPFFGVGPERIGREFKNYDTGAAPDFYTGHLHNNILQIAAERGLLCLAAFLWFLVELYRSLLRQLKKSTDNTRWVTLGSLAALTGFVISGLTEYNFGDSEVLVLLLFLVSIPFGLSTHVQEDPYSQPR